MKTLPDVWQTLLTLRDEMALQAHLMNMELNSEWQVLEKRYRVLSRKVENALLNQAKHLGEHEEHQLVGSNEEIAKLIEDFEDLRRRQQQ